MGCTKACDCERFRRNLIAKFERRYGSRSKLRVDEWVGVVLAAGLGLLIYAISAMGSAALGFIWLPRLSRSATALLASLLPPAIMALTLTIIVLSESRTPLPREMLLVFAIVCAPGFVVGWPSAFLTLRGLEKRMERAGVKAQEIFE